MVVFCDDFLIREEPLLDNIIEIIIFTDRKLSVAWSALQNNIFHWIMIYSLHSLHGLSYNEVVVFNLKPNTE